MTAQAVRVFPEVPEELGEELPLVGIVCSGEGLCDVVLRGVEELPRFGTSGFTAVRTVRVMGRDRLSAVSTGPARLFLVVVDVDEASILVDPLVHFLGRDVDVPAPHAGVEVPRDAVLDLLLGVSLPVHPRDRGVAEVVGVHRLVDARLVGDLPEPSADVRRRHGCISVVQRLDVGVRSSNAVEERRVGVFGLRMRVPQVGPHRRLGVDDRVGLLRRVLQSGGLLVGRVVRALVVELDVTDSEGPRHRGTSPRVREELDQRDVAGMGPRGDQCLDVVLAEHVLVADLVLRRRADLEIVGPVPIEVLEEDAQRLSVVPERVLAHPAASAPVVVAVLEVEQEGVDVLLRGLDQGLVEPFGRKPVAAEVLQQAGHLQTGVLVLNELPDGGTIRLCDVRFGERLELVLEVPVEVLEVVDVTHYNPPTTSWFITVSVQNPFGIVRIPSQTSTHCRQKNSVQTRGLDAGAKASPEVQGSAAASLGVSA